MNSREQARDAALHAAQQKAAALSREELLTLD